MGARAKMTENRRGKWAPSRIRMFAASESLTCNLAPWNTSRQLARPNCIHITPLVSGIGVGRWLGRCHGGTSQGKAVCCANMSVKVAPTITSGVRVDECARRVRRCACLRSSVRDGH